MAQYYNYESVKFYGPDGNLNFENTLGSVGSDDADDNFWNVGDLDDSTGFTYDGYYAAEGSHFLVFSSGGSHAVYSDFGNLTSPGYPTNYLSDPHPALITAPLALCFATGTLIATLDGERCVENLVIGDLITTFDGRTVPVKWIGQQAVSALFHPAERLRPVRFSTGSLGSGLPHTDLTVTADHAMLVEGVLCNASTLVNGTTITRVPLAEMGEVFTVYHIETQEHEIILANGCPTETFIDNVSRRVFDNYAEFEALYGDGQVIEELPYPRAMSARQVPTRLRTKFGLTNAA